VKTTQYVRQEKAIASADSGGIRERWMWGLRLLNDPEKIAESGKSLKHGVAEVLIALAGTTPKGRSRLGEQEIQRRLRCARTYKTEAEIREVVTDFGSWDELCRAGFPAYPVDPDEALADYRTEVERAHDRARALADLVGEQGSLFPLCDFEPVTTTLKELLDYTEQQEELTARFVAHGEKRRAYLDSLIEAAGNDLSLTWQAAHDRLDVNPPDAADAFAA
jgi:hypothetical protein